MAVPYGDYRMPAVKVQVFLSLVIYDMTSVSLHRSHIENTIYVEKVHLIQ